MIEVASLQYGVIFKKAFCDLEIFTAFVKDMTGQDIEIDKVETEKSFSPAVGRVDSCFDLFAEDTNNRIIVDVQHQKLPDHYDRFLHYHCVALLEQVARAKDYRPKLTVFTIVVLTGGDEVKTDIGVIDFDIKTLEGQPLYKVFHKVLYLSPKYVTDKTPEPFRTWLLAIQDTLDEQVEEALHPRVEIQKIFQLIKKDLVSPRERARMKDEYAYAQLYQQKHDQGLAMGLQQGIKQGIEQGIKQGVEQGITQGIAEGIKQGREEGKKAGMLLTAQKMKSMGVALDTIAAATGLTVAEIEHL